MILGVAFVWFTTHFGGGFASGAQIYSYYVRYGIWSLFLPLFAMAYNGVFFAYCLYFARKHEVYDYRSYNNAFYGRFAPLISVLIILGAVSTAVNMVAAMVKRIHDGLAKRRGNTETPGKITRIQILAALVCCIADFLIAQFGLLTLIQKAYSILAYLAIPVILVPYVVHMAVTRFDTKK